MGRGGDKLEAALTAFELDKWVRGRRVLDVGASTGGFSDCLLQHRASHVTAVELGRGLLHPKLREDSRVESLDGVNFRTLSLSVAPGPFDFFVLDVSHASARSMMRAIALRLRKGAHGVVLVKPQFELPKVLVPAQGIIESRNLRKFARNRFLRKARGLGFVALQRMDCPVHGGSGNIEMLLHLRFDGLPPKSNIDDDEDA